MYYTSTGGQRIKFLKKIIDILETRGWKTAPYTFTIFQFISDIFVQE